MRRQARHGCQEDAEPPKLAASACQAERTSDLIGCLRLEVLFPFLPHCHLECCLPPLSSERHRAAPHRTAAAACSAVARCPRCCLHSAPLCSGEERHLIGVEECPTITAWFMQDLPQNLRRYSKIGRWIFSGVTMTARLGDQMAYLCSISECLVLNSPGRTTSKQVQ